MIIKPTVSAVRIGADAIHRPGTKSHKALSMILKAGVKGAERSELVRKKVPQKYLSRMLRLHPKIIRSAKSNVRGE